MYQLLGTDVPGGVNFFILHTVIVKEEVKIAFDRKFSFFDPYFPGHQASFPSCTMRSFRGVLCFLLLF
jgi:hypothetical protein